MQSIVNLFGLDTSSLGYEQIIFRILIALVIFYLFMLMAGIKISRIPTPLEKLVSATVIFILAIDILNKAFINYFIPVFLLAILLRIVKVIFLSEK